MDFCVQFFFVNPVKKLVLQSTFVSVFMYSFDRAIIIIVIMFW